MSKFYTFFLLILSGCIFSSTEATPKYRYNWKVEFFIDFYGSCEGTINKYIVMNNKVYYHLKDIKCDAGIVILDSLFLEEGLVLRNHR